MQESVVLAGMSTFHNGCDFTLHFKADGRVLLGYGCYGVHWNLAQGARYRLSRWLGMNGEPKEVHLHPETLRTLKERKPCARCGGFTFEPLRAEALAHSIDFETSAKLAAFVESGENLRKVVEGEALAPHPQTVDTKEDTRGGTSEMREGHPTASQPEVVRAPTKDLLGLLEDAWEIRSAYGFLTMRMAVATDAQDAYDVAKREFSNREAAFRRLETALAKAIEHLRAAALDAAPSTPEICICAAIVTENGQVIRGHRHADCMRTAADNRLKPRSGHDAQGFITSRNRYVDRTEAARLQLAAGIPSADASAPYLHGECYSEDLYLSDNDSVAAALARSAPAETPEKAKNDDDLSRVPDGDSSESSSPPRTP